MASLSTINIKFTADLKQFSTAIQNSSRDIKQMGTSLDGIGSKLSVGLTLPILAFGAAALSVFGDIQALQLGLNSVMSDAKSAGEEFKRLREVAKLPGLGLEEAVRGSVNLQAAGFSAGQARDTLLAFGNALATVGKGKNELNLVVLALSQLQNKTGGFSQDLRQLTEQLPQLRGALKSAFGTSDGEAIQKMGVTGKQLVETLTKEFAKLPKVSGGIKNAFENMGDSVKIAMGQIGDAINRNFNIEGKLNAIGAKLADLADGFADLNPAVQKALLVVAGLAAAAGPLLVAIGGLVTLVPVVVSGFKAISAAALFLKASMLEITVAIGLAIAVYQILKSQTVELTSAQKRQAAEAKILNDINAEAATIVADQQSALTRLLSIAQDETKSKKERAAAIKEINALSPEYLGNLTIETINTEKAAASIDKYNIALLNAGKAKAAQNQLSANAQKQLKAELDYENGIASAYKLISNNQKNLNGNSAEYFKNQRDAAKIIAQQQSLLEAKLKPLKDEEALILSIYNKYQDTLGLLRGGSSEIVATGATDIETPKFEPVEIKVETDSQSTIEAIDRQIAKYTELRDKVLTANPEMAESIKATNDFIKGLELQKQFILDPSSFNKFAGSVESVGERLSAAAAGMQSSLNAIKTKTVEVGEILSTQVATFKENIAVALGEAIGTMISGGTTLSGVFRSLLGVVGEFLTSLGKSLIQVGIASVALKKAFASPFAAIAAGVALVALGAIVKNKLEEGPKFANGGIVGGNSFYGDKILARVNSGELILNDSQQRKLYSMMDGGGAAMVNIDHEIKLSGSDLRIILKRAEARENRGG